MALGQLLQQTVAEPGEIPLPLQPGVDREAGDVETGREDGDHALVRAVARAVLEIEEIESIGGAPALEHVVDLVSGLPAALVKGEDGLGELGRGRVERLEAQGAEAAQPLVPGLPGREGPLVDQEDHESGDGQGDDHEVVRHGGLLPAPWPLARGHGAIAVILRHRGPGGYHASHPCRLGRRSA